MSSNVLKNCVNMPLTDCQIEGKDLFQIFQYFRLHIHQMIHQDKLQSILKQQQSNVSQSDIDTMYQCIFYAQQHLKNLNHETVPGYKFHDEYKLFFQQLTKFRDQQYFKRKNKIKQVTATVSSDYIEMNIVILSTHTDKMKQHGTQHENTIFLVTHDDLQFDLLQHCGKIIFDRQDHLIEHLVKLNRLVLTQQFIINDKTQNDIQFKMNENELKEQKTRLENQVKNAMGNALTIDDMSNTQSDVSIKVYTQKELKEMSNQQIYKIASHYKIQVRNGLQKVAKHSLIKQILAVQEQ